MTPEETARLLDAFADPFLVIDGRQRIVRANAAASARFDRAASDLTGLDLVRVVRHPEALRAVDRVLAGETEATATFQTYRPVEGTMELRTVRLVPDGPIALMFRDTGAEREAERMRSDFVANVSHELRSPLTTLKGSIETLAGPAREDAEARDRFLDLMAREAERMDRLISDLLSLSKVESNERVRPTAPVDLVPLVQRMLDLLRLRAAEADMTIEFEGPGTALPVPGDEDQIAQVVSNLVENAIRYGAGGERVEVSLQRAEGAAGFRTGVAVLRVRDFGIGIAPQHIPRLQERFYRVDTGRSRDRGGTGLGLAIVKHIVNRHRGRVRIESVEGEGTTFEVMLPTS